jgi:hypothetical protein
MQLSRFNVSNAHRFKNLCIYFISSDDFISNTSLLTLQEAIRNNILLVSDTNKINKLLIKNNEHSDVFIQAGDIVKGGQQDRVFVNDLIIPAKAKGELVDVYCIESGRWNKRLNEDVSIFSSSEDRITSSRLKSILVNKGSQTLVWDQIKSTQNKLSQSLKTDIYSTISPSSFQLTLEHNDLTSYVDKHISALLPSRSSDCVRPIGYACIVNGYFNSADLYFSPDLFNRLWPKLLRASAIEAISEQNSAYAYNETTVDQLSHMLFNSAFKTVRKDKLSKNIKIITMESEGVFLQDLLYKNYDKTIIHRTYLGKDVDNMC